MSPSQDVGSLTSPAMWLVVGLGNPGTQYRRTRHNLGFMVIDRLAEQLRIELNQLVCHAWVGLTQSDESQVVLAKPRTYMNRSGVSAQCLLRRYQLPASQMLVIVDDLALPLGKLRLRRRGSAGGHNGLKSIIESLGSQEFPRLRLGILPEQAKIEDYADFVLSDFTADEQTAVESMIERSVTTVLTVVREGLDKAIARCH
ncbi:MAG: aminoacyl-tRNA hydrolase [Acidobacteriota bacterium]|nr:aminoacyl-tRNA hydrolase [Blastocatellia bacterium]MDW8241229.1 aminoacyl-tRNA hydrolase [Acidobacteriota bacterium]